MQPWKLRVELNSDGIDVSIVLPGTPQTMIADMGGQNSIHMHVRHFAPGSLFAFVSFVDDSQMPRRSSPQEAGAASCSEAEPCICGVLSG